MRIPVLLIILLASATLTERVVAQDDTVELPSLRLHIKAEGLYQNGHFERAYFIYVNELAAIGDKYAQYMAGYMCQHGQGMRKDPIEASAWYRLAAERGAPEFIEVRDGMLESMSEEDRVLSDARFVDLRLKYSDIVLALRHLRDERRQLGEGATGSRLGGGAGPVTVVDPRTGTPITRDEYVERVQERMQVRLDFIAERMGIERVDADMTSREFAVFSDSVDEFLRTINDR